MAAGNPPEYNKSVREFDIVTLDRVRKLEIQPDCDTWLKYAAQQNVHQAVISYLSMKKRTILFGGEYGRRKILRDSQRMGGSFSADSEL